MSHQSGKGFYQHPIKLLILSEVHHEKIGDRFSKELWWLIVGGLVKSRKLFQLFYHEERGTAVLSELFKIAVRNSISLLGLAKYQEQRSFRKFVVRVVTIEEYKLLISVG